MCERQPSRAERGGARDMKVGRQQRQGHGKRNRCHSWKQQSWQCPEHEQAQRPRGVDRWGRRAGPGRVLCRGHLA
eukprot:8174877-Heterocapsa_arctica.AAC.1